MSAAPDVVRMFAGWQVGEWAWCLHCERAYKVGEFRQVGEFQFCPYPDCDGSAVIDCWHWGEIARWMSYPEVPERDKVYSAREDMRRAI